MQYLRVFRFFCGTFVVLRWEFCRFGLCVSDNETQVLWSYVPALCNIAFFFILGRVCQFHSETFPIISLATVRDTFLVSVTSRLGDVLRAAVVGISSLL